MREDPGHSPQIVSEFSVRIHYIQHSINIMMMVQCVLSRGQAVLQCILSKGQIYGWDSGPIHQQRVFYQSIQYYNVFNREENKPMVRAVGPNVTHSILSMYSIERRTIHSDRGMPLISHFCDSLEINFGGIKGPKGIS